MGCRFSVGSVTTLFDSAVLSADFLAQDASHIYFVSGGAIYQISKTAGSTRALTGLGESVVAATSLFGSLYWADAVAVPAGELPRFHVLTAPFPTGSPDDAASGSADDAASGSPDDAASGSPDDAASGSPDDAASGSPVLDGALIARISTPARDVGSTPPSIAVTGAAVLFDGIFVATDPTRIDAGMADGAEGGPPESVPLAVLPLAGMDVTRIASPLVSDQGVIYAGALAKQGTEIARIDSYGNASVVIATTAPADLTMDADNLYWVDGERVLTVSKQGGASRTLASLNRDYSSSTQLVAIAVDASFVYWADTDGHINRLAK